MSYMKWAEDEDDNCALPSRFDEQRRSFHEGWTEGVIAARAWQALRDWLDGTAEEWQASEDLSSARAYEQGYKHARESQ